MEKRSNKKLIHTNPHLNNPKDRALAIARMIQSSSAIEHINVEIQPFLKNGCYQYKIKSARKK